MPKLALIRGFGGEPLCRAISEVRNGTVYVCSQRCKELNYKGFSPPPIGVPISDAFAFDERVFGALRNKWKAGIKSEPSEWGDHLMADTDDGL